jgi:hypothetical protein
MAGPDDYWTVNGDINFGYIPGGLTPVSADALPVRLQTGVIQGKWGHDHIRYDHADWVNRSGYSVPHLVLLKLSQPGTIYDTNVRGKFKINIILNPNSLLVLTYQHDEADPYFGVTTLYFRNSRLDGSVIGRFPGCSYAQQHLKVNPPVFQLQLPPPPPPPPTITYRKKRTFVKPAANEDVDLPPASGVAQSATEQLGEAMQAASPEAKPTVQ